MFLLNHKDKLNPRPVNVQNKTSECSLCTVSQKYRWLKTYETGRNYLNGFRA